MPAISYPRFDYGRGGHTVDPTFSVGNVRIAIWGQSNGIGRALQTDLTTSPLSSDAELAQYMDGTLPLSRVYIWTGSAYAVLTSSNTDCDPGQFGPHFGLAVRWMRETTSGNLYIQKETSSGVSIDPAFMPADVYYPGRRTRHNTATTWLATNGVTISASHWLWVQGEADSAQSQSWYQTRLESLMSGRLSDGLDTASGRKVLAQMKVGSALYGSGVAAAKTAVAAADASHVKLVALDYLKADNVHCNGRGQVQLGYDAFEQIFDRSHIAV